VRLSQIKRLQAKPHVAMQQLALGNRARAWHAGP